MYFHLLYAVLYTFFLILYRFTRANTDPDDHNDEGFKRFQGSHLTFYLFAVAGDWLQRPHLYVLYESYGFSKHQIAILFATGIVASMLFGAFCAAVHLKSGRRNECVIYALLQIMACTTNHFDNFSIIMFGRFLSGIAFTLLNFSFDSWLNEECISQGLSNKELSSIAVNASLESLLVAILSGLVSQFLAEKVGLLAPYDLSILILLIPITIIKNSGSESNGSDKSVLAGSRRLIQALKESWRQETRLICLRLVQSIFEGSLHLFSFVWSPIIFRAAGAHTLPHGHIFAAVMISTLVGSSASEFVEKKLNMKGYHFMLIAAAGLSMSVIEPDDFRYVFSGFLVLGFCSDIVWETLRSLSKTYTAGEHKTANMLMRIPVYSIVTIILILDLPVILITQFTVALLLSAAIAQYVLFKSFENDRQYEKLPFTGGNHNYS